MAATLSASTSRASDPELAIARADKANILIVDDRADKRLVFQYTTSSSSLQKKLGVN